MKNINAEVVKSAMNYQDYRKMIDDLFEKGMTTGPVQSDAMLNYTKLNIARMKRLDKTTRLTEESLADLKKLSKKQTWLVITEAWCGDAAQVVPVLNKMAEEQANIDLRFILRDENLDIMDAFLTNGGRSIPKLIVLTGDDYEVQKSWGPRPQEVQEMVLMSKAELAKIADEKERKAHTEAEKYNVQKWYAKDKTRKIQADVLEVVTES